MLATPVDGTLIDLTLVSRVKEIRRPGRRIVGFGLLSVRLRAPIINKFVSSMQMGDVLQDVTIWSRKRYVNRPRLCRSDREIMPFRAYCAQFYPDQSDAESRFPATPGAAAGGALGPAAITWSGLRGEPGP